MHLPFDALLAARFPDNLSPKIKQWLIDKKSRRDPIHDEIELNALERVVIDTPQFQRLRHIKQLDFGYQVYHGAEHTRFTHAKGVCFVSKFLVDTINANHNRQHLVTGSAWNGPSGQMRGAYPIYLWQRVLIGLAGLLHDIAQLPFSHALEKKTGLIPTHDRFDENPWLVELFYAPNQDGSGSRSLSWILRTVATPILRELYACEMNVDLAKVELDAASVIVEILSYQPKVSGDPPNFIEEEVTGIVLPVPSSLAPLLLKVNSALKRTDVVADQDAIKGVFNAAIVAPIQDRRIDADKLRRLVLWLTEDEVKKPEAAKGIGSELGKLKALLDNHSADSDAHLDWPLIRWCFSDSAEPFRALLADDGSGDFEPAVMSVRHSEYFQPFMSELIANTICADIMDYISRDYANLGLKRSIDLSFLRAMRVGPRFQRLGGQSEVQNARHVYFKIHDRTFDFRMDVVTEILHLLEMRYILGERLIFHRTRLAQQELFVRCVFQYLSSRLDAMAQPENISLRSILDAIELVRDFRWPADVSGDNWNSDDSLLLVLGEDETARQRESPQDGSPTYAFSRTRILRERLFPFRPVLYVNHMSKGLGATDFVNEFLDRVCPPSASPKHDDKSAFARMRAQSEVWHTLRNIELGVLPTKYQPQESSLPDSIQCFICCLSPEVHFKQPLVWVQCEDGGNLALLSNFAHKRPEGLSEHIEALRAHYRDLWKAVLFLSPDVCSHFASMESGAFKAFLDALRTALDEKVCANSIGWEVVCDSKPWSPEVESLHRSVEEGIHGTRGDESVVRLRRPSAVARTTSKRDGEKPYTLDAQDRDIEPQQERELFPEDQESNEETTQPGPKH